VFPFSRLHDNLSDELIAKPSIRQIHVIGHLSASTQNQRVEHVSRSDACEGLFAAVLAQVVSVARAIADGIDVGVRVNRTEGRKCWLRGRYCRPQ